MMIHNNTEFANKDKSQKWLLNAHKTLARTNTLIVAVTQTMPELNVAMLAWLFTVDLHYIGHLHKKIALMQLIKK